MDGKVTNGEFVRLVIEHIAINWDEDNKNPSNPKDYLVFVGEVLRERGSSRRDGCEMPFPFSVVLACGYLGNGRL